MDPERRSNVSSFYGSRERRSSFDTNAALAGGPSQPGPHHRVDSTSSSAFFNPNRLSRTSAELLTNEVGMINRGVPGSAGYNQTSFFAAGREEPVKGGRDEEQPLHQGGGLNAAEQGEGWDVYADFNNTGPRYSTAFSAKENGNGYRKIPPGASKPETPGAPDSEGPVELVTVPALGAEWKASELRDMTKSGRREARTDERMAKWRAWRRDQAGMCGIKWLTGRVFVFIVFVIIIIVGITLAFTIPRVPSFSFNTDSPISGGSDVRFSRSPANFSFDTNLNFQVSTHGNYIPLHFQSIHADVFDLNTNAKIAAGDLTSQTLPANQFSQLRIPIRFNFTAVNASDQTWLDVYNACRNLKTVPPNQSRPPLKLQANLRMKIAGLLSHPTAGPSIDSAACPFQLPINGP